MVYCSVWWVWGGWLFGQFGRVCVWIGFPGSFGVGLWWSCLGGSCLRIADFVGFGV